jgi:hypothetical protein
VNLKPWETAEWLLHGAKAKAKYYLISLGLTDNDAADEALMNARLAVCKACPHATKNAEGIATTHSRCGLCRCPLVQKAALQSERCPDSRWQENKAGCSCASH